MDNLMNFDSLEQNFVALEQKGKIKHDIIKLSGMFLISGMVCKIRQKCGFFQACADTCALWRLV